MTWQVFTLLALATFRLTRLLGWDDLTIPFRRWLTGMSDKDHDMWAKWIDNAEGHGIDAWDATERLGTPEGDPPPVSRRRFYLSRLIRCPWCAGFWLCLGVALLWWACPAPVEVVAVPLALSAVVGLVAHNLDT